MDNKTKTGKGDDTRINVNQTYEVQYWSEKFSVSREKLRAAVEAVGPAVSEVEKYLKNKRKSDGHGK